MFGASFGENHAPRGGGFASIRGSITIMEDVVFSGNAAEVGAGLYLYNSPAFLNYAQFVANAATTSGALGIVQTADFEGNVTVHTSHFSSNSGSIGGAWFSSPGELSVLALSNCVFDSNSATAAGGGVMHTCSSTSCAYFNVSRVLFTRNQANSAGALYVSSCPLVLHATEFVKNVGYSVASAMLFEPADATVAAAPTTASSLDAAMLSVVGVYMFNTLASQNKPSATAPAPALYVLRVDASLFVLFCVCITRIGTTCARTGGSRAPTEGSRF